MPYQKKLMIIIVFILVFFVMGYVYDIHPLVTHVAELNKAEINANKKLLAMAEQKKNIQPEIFNNQHVDKSELSDVSQLIAFIHSSGLIIQTSSFLSSSQNKVMHLVLGGDYQQLLNFLDVLEKQTEPSTLQNFSYKLTEKNDLLVTMDVLLSKQIRHLQEINGRDDFVSRHNPFCVTENINKWMGEADVNAALSAPIEHIKMVGFLQRGKRRQALVMLPNSIVRTVEPGFLLGSESGVVVAINSDKTLVKLPNGRVFVLALAPK